MKPSDERRVGRLHIRNHRSITLTFTLEPWGDEYLMVPGAVFEVQATGPAEGILEVEATEEGFTIYGWTGSIVEVFHEGKALGGSGRPSVPSAPPGQSIRDVVGWMKKHAGK